MPETNIKKIIRRQILQKRDAMPNSARKEKDIVIARQIMQLPEFISAKTIFSYASFRSEVNTMGIINASFSIGKRIVMPKVDRELHRLKLYEIKNIGELARGYMWILEPSVSGERLRSIDDIDLVIIPGAAFDTYGNRLGYGAGFYDMTLSGMKKKIPIIAPAYEEQIVENIPSEPHDIRVDKVVTDKEIIDCTKVKSSVSKH